MGGSRKHGWRRRLGGKGVRGAEDAEPRRRRSRGVRNGEGVSPSTADQEVWGSVPKTDFSAFQESQNACCLDACLS